MILKNYVFGPLLCQMTVEQEDIEKIKLLFDRSPKYDFKKRLIGNLQGEFFLNLKSYSNIIHKYIYAFKQNCEDYYGRKYADISLVSAWVNFMKKGDYNPPHIHNDCDFSSVMFIQAPEELKKEAKDFYNQCNSDYVNGPWSLQFIHGNYENKNDIALRSFEPKIGDFFIFPSWLLHYVNPFRCDGDRISVAANFKEI